MSDKNEKQWAVYIDTKQSQGGLGVDRRLTSTPLTYDEAVQERDIWNDANKTTAMKSIAYVSEWRTPAT